MSNIIDFTERLNQLKKQNEVQHKTYPVGKPFWIQVNDAQGEELFEGHQGHWSDTYFSNAYLAAIENFCDRQGYGLAVREMTDEELIKYPEAIIIQAALIAEYGED